MNKRQAEKEVASLIAWGKGLITHCHDSTKASLAVAIVLKKRSQFYGFVKRFAADVAAVNERCKMSSLMAFTLLRSVMSVSGEGSGMLSMDMARKHSLRYL